MPYGVKKVQLFALFLIVVTAGGLMLYAAWTDAPIFDESAHIPAGYSYVRYFDYRLNHEHPPLVKALAGLPLLFGNVNFPVASDAWTKDINGQWSVGAQFFYGSGNDARLLVFLARLGPIFITLITIIFVYYFARKLVGGAWALLPALLFGLSPNILAHGHYVTTDIGAALGVLVSFYYLLNYLETPTRKYSIYAGVAFGVAELLKFSNILLGPIFILFFLIYAFVQTFGVVGDRREKFLRFWMFTKTKGLGLIAIFLIGFVVIYLVYALFTLNYPGTLAQRDIGSVISPDFKIPFARSLTLWLASIPVLKPIAVFIFGILSVFQRTEGGNAAFFLGELSGKGWWYYFPVVYLLKEPLSILVLITLGALYALQTARYSLRSVLNYIRDRSWETAMLLYILLYWANSMASPLNIGIRHIIPTLPFIYILAAKALRNWLGFVSPQAVWGNTANIFRYVASLPKLFLKSATLAALCLWLLLETISVAPHYLSYFNEFTGTANGYRYVTDSNYDWGQDLYRLQDFVEKNNIQKIAVDYFGGGSPNYALGDKEENWWSSRGNPKDQGIEWLAVSTNVLSGALGKPLPDFERKPENEYYWLQAIHDPNQPDARAGYSIFIYKL